MGNKHFSLANLVRASTAAPHFFDPEVLPITDKAVLPASVAMPVDVPLLRRALRMLLQDFLPKKTPIDEKAYGLFVDGGVTPHNNPALALFNMVTWSPFNIQWDTGPDKLMIVSIGTGTYKPTLSYDGERIASFAKLAFQALLSLMSDAERSVLALMQWMGECPDP